MIIVEKIESFGFEAALRGMRNPLNSWNKADSVKVVGGVDIGVNDLDLAKRLIRAGSTHRKFTRMIHVQMDVTAPLYWWKDYDTYKVSTVANSCSTMHKIHAKEFTFDDFSTDQLDTIGLDILTMTIKGLNFYRDRFNEDPNDKHAWYSMIQLLPSSYMQKRTLDLNYETILGIVNDRKNHKLYEFRNFCEVLLKELPYLRVFWEAGY